MTTRTAWFHCFSGVAGDMALGACLDAGADLAEVRTLLGGLGVDGWELTTEPVTRSGLAGTRAVVTTTETGHHRRAADIVALVESAPLPDRVRRRALAVFDALAVAEGRIHRTPPADVHFHEVGGIDAIVDIVGTCAALESLAVDRVACSPVTVGRGIVHTAHGRLPNPAPAVVELLTGAPIEGLDVDVELTTPTGAALMAALADSFGPLPSMTIAASGFGAGSADPPDRPNLVQVVVGDDVGSTATERLTLVETNVDDVTGEHLGEVVIALLAAGALDAWITPVVMKKGRPAHQISALTTAAALTDVAGTLARATGTLGVRSHPVDRRTLDRHTVSLEVDGVTVRVKVGPHGHKPEHDDVLILAAHLDVTAREAERRAQAAWFSGPGSPSS